MSKNLRSIWLNGVLFGCLAFFFGATSINAEVANYWNQSTNIRGRYVVSVLSPTKIQIDTVAIGAGYQNAMSQYYPSKIARYDVYVEGLSINEGKFITYPFLGYGVPPGSSAQSFSGTRYNNYYAPGNSNKMSESSWVVSESVGGKTVKINEAAYFWGPYGGFPVLTSETGKTTLYTFGTAGPPRAPDLGELRDTKEKDNQIGDPVNVTTGELHGTSVDLRVEGAIPIELRRTYSSRNGATNELGVGWLSNWNSYLLPSDDLQTIKAADADGSVILFRRYGEADVWTVRAEDNPQLNSSAGGAGNPYNARISCAVAGGATTYNWELPDGSIRKYVMRSFPVIFSGIVYSREQAYLDSWADNCGNILSFTYYDDPEAPTYGMMHEVKASTGRSIAFDYDYNRFLIQATASDGRVVKYYYSAHNLIKVVLADSKTLEYKYQSDVTRGGLLVKEIKPDGRVLENTYDSFYRVIAQKATVGGDAIPVTNATFDYSVTGTTTVKDAYNNRTIYEYNGGMITKITDPLNQVITKEWWTDTDVITGAYKRSLRSVTDKRGMTTSYKYDAVGNVVEVACTGDLDGNPTTTETSMATASFNDLNMPDSVTNESGVTVEFIYEDEDYPYLPTTLISKKGADVLRVDKMEYTERTEGGMFSRGLLAKKYLAYGSDDQATTEFDYDVTGFAISRTAYTGTSDPDVVSTFAPTDRGEVRSIVDGDGRSYHLTYDAAGRLLTKTVKDEAGLALATWRTSYNGNGEVRLVDGPRSAPEDWVERDYDQAGRLKEDRIYRSQAKPDGTGVAAPPATNLYTKTTFFHDFFGNLSKTIDSRGNATAFTYDGIGQLLSRNFYLGSDTAVTPSRTEFFEYEAGGLVSKYTNPFGGVTEKNYTSSGRLRRQSNADGSVLEWRYYTDGRLYREIRRDLSYWESVYDDVARQVTRRLKSPGGGSILAEETTILDRRGNVVRRTDPEGYTAIFAYDDLDRLKMSAGPASSAGTEAQSTSIYYGASSKIHLTVNALGEKVITTSDAMGRPLLRQIKSAADVVVRETSYFYSTDHQSVTITEGTGVGAISRVFYSDVSGRPLLTRFSDGAYIYSDYDTAGNLISNTDELNRTTTFTYDELNQCVTQMLPDGNVTTFSYDAAGHPIARGMAGGLTAETLYDSAGRILSSRLVNGESESRVYSYTYYPPAHETWSGLLATVTDPRGIVRTLTYDGYLQPATVATNGIADETDSLTTYGYDRRGLITSVEQSSLHNAAGLPTHVNRSYDGYRQLKNEVLKVDDEVHSEVSHAWDAAGRRTSLSETGSALPSPVFSYKYRADGRLTEVDTLNSEAEPSVFKFGYGDTGLLASRINSYRTLEVNTRDPRGRTLQQTTIVANEPAMVEALTWRSDSTLNSYSLTKGTASTLAEVRAYSYNIRGQLISEGFSPVAEQSHTLNYQFDNGSAGLGIRSSAKIGVGGDVSWETAATGINSLARVTDDALPATSSFVVATGTAMGASRVSITVDGVMLGRARHPGWTDSTGTWSMDLNLNAGSHTLIAEALHPSKEFTTSATSTFSIAGTSSGSVANVYDSEGHVNSRIFADGHVQTLTWDAYNRLVKIAQRDASGDGYDWRAVYDALGRRLKTIQQPVTAGVASGSVTQIASIYDPLVEFLEIGVAVNGVKAWKVYGPDLNGVYGGLNGTGGLEATILDADGTAKGVINDGFGNGVASVTESSVTWFTTRVGGYGPLPGSAAETLTDITRLAEATAWRGRRIDPTGFYNLGARYYEPTSGRFLSPDPMGHATSMSLYDFANGDPVNQFDADGRMPIDTQLNPSNNTPPNNAPIPLTFKNFAAVVIDAAGKTIVGASLIGSDQFQPGSDRAQVVGTGYQIARTDVGQATGVPVDNPRFELASTLTSAIGTYGLTSVAIPKGLRSGCPKAGAQAENYATTPLVQNVTNVADDAIVHFAPDGYSVVKPGVSGEVYTFQYGDIKHLSPTQIETVIGPLSNSGLPGGATVMHVLEATASQAVKAPGGVVNTIPEYIFTQSVPASEIIIIR